MADSTSPFQWQGQQQRPAQVDAYTAQSSQQPSSSSSTTIDPALQQWSSYYSHQSSHLQGRGSPIDPAHSAATANANGKRPLSTSLQTSTSKKQKKEQSYDEAAEELENSPSDKAEKAKPARGQK
jgi:hypothetical protein